MRSEPRHHHPSWIAATAAALALTACQPSAVREAPARSPAPHAAAVAGVAAANPYAVEAGLDVLRAGGSAADAAVAVQAMLGLVEPQSSGIGGGAFLLYYDAQTARVTAFDGREAAPAGATAGMFLGPDGAPLGYRDAVTSGRSTGVPGVMPMLGAAHEQFGRLPWSRLFDASVRAAADGFTVPQRLGAYVNGQVPGSGVSRQFPQVSLPDALALFTRPDGSTIQPGDLLRNPDYADTLRTLADRGPRALLEPPIADRIIARTHDEPLPGTLSRPDFATYEPRTGEPVCGPFLVYVVCVPPPPSSGVSLLQLLAILEATDIASRGPEDPQAWFLFAEASRLMYADRNEYIADPKFVEVPVHELLEPGYVAARATLIGGRAGPAPEPGRPPGFARGADATVEASGTSHFVVVDAEGDVVSMTTSVESLFGSGRAVGGFFLNNQLTDFSFRPETEGKPVANAVAGGKRPRSSMSPVIVLDGEGKLLAALGSPGGSSILAYNAKTLLGLLAWKMPLQEAIDLPNLVASGGNFYGEAGRFPTAVASGLADRGIEVKSGRGENSGLHGIVVQQDGRIEGAADPRREGVWRTVR